MLATCCDVRVMTEDGRIGLNEVELGIPVPLYWGRLMASLVGAGRADVLLQTAALVPAKEALRLGLVDAVVPKAELMAAAHAVRMNCFAHLLRAHTLTPAVRALLSGGDASPGIP